MSMGMERTFLYFFVGLTLYIFTTHLLRRIRNLPPTPFPSLPILGHLYLFKKPMYRTLAKISQKYGPITLLNFGSRRVLLISSPEAVEECLTKNDITFANRPRLLIGKILAYNYTSMPWAPYGDQWRNLRRISSLEILSTHRLQTLCSIRADEARAMVHQLSIATQPVNMKSAFFELTMNVLMRMIAGKRYIGKKVEDKEAAESYQEILRETETLSFVANLGDYMPIIGLLGMGSTEKKMVAHQNKRDAFMQRLLDENRQRNEELSQQQQNEKTLMQVLLSLQQTDPEYYTDTFIKNLMLTLISSGTNTSTATMEWAMTLLVNNPRCLKKAQDEIDSVVGSDRFLEESDLSKLPYLHSIIKETLRMYPPGPLAAPHESFADCTVGGFHVPRGTMLLMNLWAIQNDPKIWKDPKEFKPERFEGLAFDARVGFKYLPFGSGRRSCPGEGLGMRMVGLAIGLLLQCLEWERPGEELVDMTESHRLSLAKAVELVVKCRPRNKMVDLLELQVPNDIQRVKLLN